MSKVFIEDSILTNIASAVRSVTGTTASLRPSQIPNALTSQINSVRVTGVTIDDFSGTTQQWFPDDDDPNKRYKLTATISPTGATNQVTNWKSSDSSVVKVEKDSTDGYYYAYPMSTSGTATITVTTADGNYTDTFTVQGTVGTQWDRLIAAGAAGTHETEFPVGTILKTPYSYNGTEYEWEFAVDYSNEVAEDGNTYLVANLWSVYGTVEAMKWHSSQDNRYKNSTVRTFINGDWLNRFTDADFTKHLAATQIKTLPYNSTTADVTVDKVFLPSTSEINVLASSQSKGYLPADDVEGYASDYWKQRTGSTSRVGISDKNNGRKICTIGNKTTAQRAWLRSANRSASSYAWYCSPDGTLLNDYVGDTSYRVAPACRILLKKVSA